MVFGVGIDIVDLEEFRGRLSDELIAELYLPQEISYARTQVRSWENFAARLAAKEATFKALGAGLSQGLRWRDVEVCKQASGQVTLELHGKALERAQSQGVTELHLSLSHARHSAIATVVVEGKERQ